MKKTFPSLKNPKEEQLEDGLPKVLIWKPSKVDTIMILSSKCM